MKLAILGMNRVCSYVTDDRDIGKEGQTELALSQSVLLHTNCEGRGRDRTGLITVQTRGATNHGEADHRRGEEQQDSKFSKTVFI